MSKPELKLTVPYASDLNRIREVVQALYQNKIYEKTTTIAEINVWTGIHIATLSHILKFLRFLNVLDIDSKPGVFKLSEEGKELGESILHKNTSKEKEVFCKIINVKLNDLVQFCTLRTSNSTLEYKDLFQHIARITNTVKIDSNYKKGIETIIEILIAVGIINDSYTPSKNTIEILKSESTQKRISEIPTTVEPKWITLLFQSLNNVKPEKIGKSFVTGNIVGSKNEGKVLKLVKFLGISDDQENRGENYDKLNCYGENEFQENLQKVLQEKYDKIFKVVDIKNTTFDNLVNLTSREYDLDKSRSQRAMSVLSTLCQLAGINISGIQTNKFQKESNTQNNRNIRGTQNKTSSSLQNTKTNSQDTQLQNVIQEKFGVDIKINIDAKDNDSFENTLNFMQKLTGMSKGIFKINVSKELENKDSS